MKYIILQFLAFSLLGCLETQPVITGLEGKPLPSFNLLLPDSSTYININNLQGNHNAIVLFIYSPRCPYCRSQMKEMLTNMNRLKNIQFVVVTSYPFKEMKSFISNYKLQNYSNIITGVDMTGSIESYFSLSGVPFTAIYGKDKKLKVAFIGQLESEKLKELSESENH